MLQIGGLNTHDKLQRVVFGGWFNWKVVSDLRDWVGRPSNHTYGTLVEMLKLIRVRIGWLCCIFKKNPWSGPGVFFGAWNRNLNEKRDNRGAHIVSSSNPYNFHPGPGCVVRHGLRGALPWHLRTFYWMPLVSNLLHGQFSLPDV